MRLPQVCHIHDTTALITFCGSVFVNVRRALDKDGTKGLVAKRQEETVDFLAWAQHYVDELDPLCATPHDPDLETEHPGYYSRRDKDVHETLDRLLGNRWSEAFKVGHPAPSTVNPSPE